jgi:hypothetical protein
MSNQGRPLMWNKQLKSEEKADGGLELNKDGGLEL